MNRDIYQNTLMTYLVLLLLDTVWERSVSYYLNLNSLLIVVIVSGIVTGLSQEKSREEGESVNTTKRLIASIVILGATGSLLIYQKISFIGTVSVPISVISGLLLILLSFLTLRERKIIAQSDD